MEVDRLVGAGGDARAARDAGVLVHVADRARGGHRIFRQHVDDAARGSVSLADRFRQVLRIVRGAAQEHPVGGEIHGPQLDVGLLEEAVRIQRHLEKARQFLARRRRNHCGGERDQVGVQGKPPAQDRIGDGDPQQLPAALLDRLDHGLVVRLVADELDALARRLAVVVLPEPVGPHVPEDDGDIDLGGGLSQLQGVLDRLAAADPAAVVSLRRSAAHALDHHHALDARHRWFFRGEPPFQLEQRQYPIVLPVEVFGRLVLLGAGRDDRRAVAYLPHPALGPHLGREIPHVTGHLLDGGIRGDVYRGMPVDLAGDIAQIRLDIQSFEGVVDPARHAAQVGILFHQIDLESLLGHVQGAGHPGHASAYDQDLLVHRQFDFLQRLQQGGSGDRHAHDVLRLRGGFILLAGVHPGAVLPDVRHVEEVLIDSAFPHRVPEQGLVGPRRAGGDHHAVEPLVADDVRYLLGIVGGAGEQAFLGVNDVVQPGGVFDHGGNVDHPADIRAAVAHENAHLGFLFRNIPFLRIDALPAQLAALGGEHLAAQGGGPARGHDRFGDVGGSLEGSACIDSRARGLDRIERIGLAEPVRIELDAELLRQVGRILGRAHSHRQNDQVEFLFLHAVAVGRVADGDVLAVRDLPADRHVASDEPHAGQVGRPLVVALEVLAEGADVVVEHRRVDVRVMVLGQDHLLLGIRAADRRAVGVAAGDDLPGADALDPGDPVRMLAVGRTQDLAFEGTGGGDDAFEFEAGDDVLHLAVAEVAPHRGVEHLEARRQHDRADLDLQLVRLLMQIDRPVLADPDADVALLVLKVEAGGRIDIGDERHRLRKVDVDRLGQRQILVVGIGDLGRAVLDAGRAAGALVLDDVAGLPVQGDLEVARLPLDADDFGIAQDVYVGMPAAFDELGRLDAHRAVVGGKRLVELRHLAADGRRLVHEVDPEAGFGEIEGGLNAADAAADDQHVSDAVVARIVGCQSFKRHALHAVCLRKPAEPESNRLARIAFHDLPILGSCEAATSQNRETYVNPKIFANCVNT